MPPPPAITSPAAGSYPYSEYTLESYEEGVVDASNVGVRGELEMVALSATLMKHSPRIVWHVIVATREFVLWLCGRGTRPPRAVHG